MARTRPLWLLTVPLALGGAFVGHGAGYGIGPSPRDHALHGYLEHAPLFLAVCLALVVAALALRVTGRLQGKPSAWPLALLAPLAFSFQEIAERVAAGVSPATLAEPAVLFGLLLQLPIALLALFVARALLACADAIAAALAAPPRPSPAPPRLLTAPGRPLLLRPALAYGRLGRAPPRR